MRVSLVMTTFNGERFVAEQLKSIKEQSRTIDEVLVLDDCSQDQTVEIVRNFIKKNELHNWSLTCNKNNVGYIKNFYEGIKKATGDIVFLCDQDDIWKNTKVEEMIRALEKDDNILCLNTTVELIDRDGNEIIQDGVAKDSNAGILLKQPLKKEVDDGMMYRYSLEEIVSDNISPGCTMCFRKCIQEEYINRKCLCLPHDWIINIIAAEKNGTFLWNNRLTKYRIHGNNEIGLPIKTKSTNTKLSWFDFKKARNNANKACISAQGMLYLYTQYGKKIDPKYQSQEGIEFLAKRASFYNEPSIDKWRELLKNLYLYDVLLSKSLFFVDTFRVLLSKTKTKIYEK